MDTRGSQSAINIPVLVFAKPVGSATTGQVPKLSRICMAAGVSLDQRERQCAAGVWQY